MNEFSSETPEKPKEIFRHYYRLLLIAAGSSAIGTAIVYQTIEIGRWLVGTLLMTAILIFYEVTDPRWPRCKMQ
jgi:hypothetical protein